MSLAQQRGLLVFLFLFVFCLDGQDASPPSSPARWTNHLANARSPYLLQHAHNPVDWYPWGEEAFARARSQNKLIFLSVGYSTCHWCHVMERESFEDPALAAILNEHFVSIKVDREERPDVDAVYMGFVQASTGRGGWPMSVWLTPDLKPITGASYFPPDQFKEILERIATAWQTEREQMIHSSESVMKQLQDLTRVQSSKEQPDSTILTRAYESLEESFDTTYGGFGRPPKFPRPSVFNFLLRYYYRQHQERAREMVLATLQRMARGGIRDHLGGGFHRYSTDRRWFLPHFEKMLYDQAQLAQAYVEAYQLTKDEEFAATARAILDYVLRDLTGPQGQFYSAEDADSLIPGETDQKGEGAYYVWERVAINELLGEPLAEIFSYQYGIKERGNVTQDLQGEFKNKNVLWVAHDKKETAWQFKLEGEIDPLQKARKILLAAREKRPRPHLDDKTLTSWNGLMISALARASQVLDEPRYLEAAERAAQFIKKQLFREGSLLRRARGDHADIDGFADDYAFLIQGLLDLYEASFRVEWFNWAGNLQTKQDELFWDEQGGGYFKTVKDAPGILLRLKEDYDGAEPAPSSVAALNLFRLAEMTGKEAWRERGQQTLRAFGEFSTPAAMPQLLVAAEFHIEAPEQIVLAGRLGSADLRALLRVVHSSFRPNKILLLLDGGSAQEELARTIPSLADMKMINDHATAYVCHDYHCELPVTDPEKLAALLQPKVEK